MKWVISFSFIAFFAAPSAWSGSYENALKLRLAIASGPQNAKSKPAEVIKLPVSRGFHQRDSSLCWSHSFLNAIETMDRVKNPSRQLELSRAAFQRRTMEDRVSRRLQGTHNFMSERGTPIDALALARKHGLIAFVDYTDIVLKAEKRYSSVFQLVERADSDLEGALNRIFAPWPSITHLDDRELSPLQLSEELLASQTWVAYAPGSAEGWVDHPDTDARPEARAYQLPLEKITGMIREALLDNRPVTYGGNGHSILIYGASYDEEGRPLRYFIKDSYEPFFYEAAPRKLNSQMLEVTLVVKNPPPT